MRAATNAKEKPDDEGGVLKKKKKNVFGVCCMSTCAVCVCGFTFQSLEQSLSLLT